MPWEIDLRINFPRHLRRGIEMKRIKMSHFKLSTLTIIILFSLLIQMTITFAQEETSSSEPFTLEDIIGLLENGVENTTIIEQIEENKVDFDELTVEDIRELIRAGASDELIEAIEENPYEPIVIISPREDEECGATVRVTGRSRIFPDRHLWLFTHVKGLGVWWPQRGEVIVEENGEWVQGASLGGEQDIGFDFELKVIWVNEEVHEQMEEYLAKGEATGRYPGIRLPEGGPSVQVTVKKVRH